MNREILFRGKRTDNGEWVEGDLLHSPDGTIRIHNSVSFYTLNSFTVCQYTGLKDKAGKMIFEDDIVKIDGLKWCNGWVRFGCYAGDALSADLDYGWYVEFLPEEGYYRHDFGYWLKRLTVIGNIYDNGELLECSKRADKRVEQQVIQDVLASAT